MDRKVLETGNFRFSNGYFPLDSDAKYYYVVLKNEKGDLWHSNEFS